MALPWAAVPLPGGNPAPSGLMLMSHNARSDSLIDWPRPGVSAAALDANMNAAAMRRFLRIDMFHLALAVDAPAGDDVHVSHRERSDGEVDFRLTALRQDLGAGRLHVAGLVPGAALQHHRLAVPAPGHAEARQRLAQHRLLQRRLRPALAAVGGDHDPRDAAVAGIGEAGDLVEARSFQRQTGRGLRHERLDLLREVELPG